MLKAMRQAFPGIAIELVPSDSTENLLLREADIAVRMFRPTQLDLITRKLGEIPIVATAHEDYLARHGTPTDVEQLHEHELLGFDRSDLIITAARQMGFALARNNFQVRTDSQTAMWELARAGLGIAFAQAGLVRETPGMTHILPALTPPRWRSG